MKRLIAFWGGYFVVAPLCLVCLEGHRLEVADYANARTCARVLVQSDDWTVDALELAIEDLYFEKHTRDWVCDGVEYTGVLYEINPRGKYNLGIESASNDQRITKLTMDYDASDEIDIDALSIAPEPEEDSRFPITAALAFSTWCAFLCLPNRGASKIVRWVPLVVSICATGWLLFGSLAFVLEFP